MVRVAAVLSLALLCSCAVPSASPTPTSSTTVAPSTTVLSSTTVRPSTTVPPGSVFVPTDHVIGWPDSEPEPLDRAARIMVVGDSAAGSLGLGMERWAANLASQFEVTSHGWINCPVTPTERGRWLDDIEFAPDPGCFEVGNRATAVEMDRPDVILAYSGIWELVDKQLPGRDVWSSLGDPDVDDATSEALGELTDVLATSGAWIVWVLQPPNRNGIYGEASTPLAEEDPARVERLNEIITEIAATRQNVLLLDLPGAWSAQLDDPAGLDHRPDGFHWSDNGAERDAAWLVPLLSDLAARSVQPAR